MRLYRFEYSCYARKVQMALDLAGYSYQVIDVRYGDRNELAALTGGYIQVPVLVDDQECVFTDSRKICQKLAGEPKGRKLIPEGLEGPVWAYADWCDGPFEDIMFRLATPLIAPKFPTPWEKALFIWIKERKFGSGCVQRWEAEKDELVRQARALFQPTAETLSQQPFVFGNQPTLADAALYGECAMLKAAHPELPATVLPGIEGWMGRMESWRSLS